MSEFRIPGTHITPDAIASNEAKQAQLEDSIHQEAAKESLQEWAEEGFNPLAMMRRFRPLDEQRRKTTKGAESEASKMKKIKEVKDAEETADKFHNRNPELFPKTLLILRERLSGKDSPEDVLRKVLEIYSDYTLADDALDYLLETTTGQLHINVRAAKDALNAYYERQIKAGRNISDQAKTFSEKGLGTPTALRDMYRDITGNPRPPQTLFDELSKKFEFSMLSQVSDFLLHSLGSDLKAKGPSISRAELKRLMDDIRSLQSILGVFSFFQSREDLIEQLFLKHHLQRNPQLYFETLAKKFVDLLKERYLSPEKVFMMAKMLGISSETLAQIIIFMQMRDAVRQISPRLYRDEKHKQEVLQTLIETLEELEDRLDEEEEGDDE